MNAGTVGRELVNNDSLVTLAHTKMRIPVDTSLAVLWTGAACILLGRLFSMLDDILVGACFWCLADFMPSCYQGKRGRVEGGQSVPSVLLA